MKQKPSLGQHFLTSHKALKTIIACADLKKDDVVLEIGPGKGFLTKELLLQGARVYAIEKDTHLVQHLQETFADDIEKERLLLIEGDIRDSAPQAHIPAGTSYSVVANIPYYITGEILRTFLGGERQPSRMVLLVQKEVAERIAKSTKESILSLSVKAYGEPQYRATVPRGAFSPPPQVDSAILSIENISRKHFDEKTERIFFMLVKSGFSQKRKMLKGNLKALVPEHTLSTFLDELDVPHTVRAEDVPFPKWLRLAELSKDVVQR